MFKVTLLLVCLLVARNITANTTIATTLTPNESSDELTTSSGNECLYEDELWPSVDATKFNFCLRENNTVVEQACSVRTIFVKNETISGCIPLAQVSENCVYHDTLGNCTGINLFQPQKTEYPTNYYMCTSKNAAPNKMSCPPGKAFVHEQGFLGCFTWEQWRKIRGCTLWE